MSRPDCLQRIVSGGQTGADRGGLDAALDCGFPHSGWCPRGRRAEDGRIPERYVLRECAEADYLTRTERNVRDSDGTVILTLGILGGGSLRTAEFAERHGRPWLHLRLARLDDAEATRVLRDFVLEHQIRVLNVAGSRGSKEPRLQERVRRIVGRVIAGVEMRRAGWRWPWTRVTTRAGSNR